MLDAGEEPSLPAWTGSFYTEDGEHAALRKAVSRFQESLVAACWYLAPAQLEAGEDLRAELTAQVEALQMEGRYEARKLMDVDFRSFDRQSENLAVVTVRETWQDTLHAFEGEMPSYEEPVTAERGPYTVDLTYTLEQTEPGDWHVTRLVYDREPPDWE